MESDNCLARSKLYKKGGGMLKVYIGNGSRRVGCSVPLD